MILRDQPADVSLTRSIFRVSRAPPRTARAGAAQHTYSYIRPQQSLGQPVARPTPPPQFLPEARILSLLHTSLVSLIRPERIHLLDTLRPP